MQITQNSVMEVRRTRNVGKYTCYECSKIPKFRYDFRFHGFSYWNYTNCPQCYQWAMKNIAVECEKRIQELHKHQN